MVWRLVLCACGLVAWGVTVVWVAVAGRFRVKKPPKRLRRRNQMLARRKRCQAALVVDPEDPPTWDTEGQHERRWEGWALDGDGIPVCQHPSCAGQVAVPVEGWFEVEVTRRPIPDRDEQRPVYTRPSSAGKNSPVTGVSEAPVGMPEHGLPEGGTVEILVNANVSGQEQVPMEMPDYEGCGDGEVDLEISGYQAFAQEMSPLKLAMIWMNQIYEGIWDLEEEKEEEAKKNETNEQEKMEGAEEGDGDSQEKEKFEEEANETEEAKSKTEDERFDPEKAGDEPEKIETKEDDRNDKESETNSQAKEEPKKDSVRESWRTFSRIQVPKRSRSCESCGEKEDEDESDIWRRFHRQGWQCPSWEERTKTHSMSDKKAEEPELSSEQISQASCDDLPFEVFYETQKMPDTDGDATVSALDTKVKDEPKKWYGEDNATKEEIDKIFVEVPDEGKPKPGAAEEYILPAAEPDVVKSEPKKQTFVSSEELKLVVPEFSSKVLSDCKEMPGQDEDSIVPAPKCKEAKPKAKKRKWFSKLFKRRQCGEDCCPKELFKAEGKMTLRKKLKRLYCCGRPVL